MNIEQIIAQAATAAGQTQATPFDLSSGQPSPSQVQVPTPDQAYAIQANASTGNGMASADPVEQDMRTLTALELQQKYGAEQGQQMAIRRSLAQAQVLSDKVTPRNFSQAAADTVTDVGLGMANAVGGAAALGAGLVNRDAGLAVAGALDDLNKAGKNSQSPAQQAASRLVGAESQLAFRDNKKAMDDAIASGESEASAGIKRVLADIGSSVIANATNGTALGSLVAQGVGSVLPVGPVVRAASLIGNAGLNAAVKTGSLSVAEAAKIASIGSTAGGALTIGGMEAGGAYQQSANQVMEMSHEQLMKGSEQYQALIGEGVSPEEAQAIIANKAGLASAGMTAPFAIAMGKAVARFEVDPLARTSLANAARTTALETIEEGAQGGGAQVAGNAAIQQIANSDQEITDGVGEQIGTGMLAGAGLAAGLQVPGVVGNTVAPVMDKAAEGLRNVASNIQGKVEPTKVAPTTSMPVAAQQAETVVQQAPAMAERVQAEINASTDAPEVKAQKSEAFTALTQAFNYSPSQFDDLQLATGNKFDSALGEKLKSSTNLASAIQTVGDHLASGVSDEVGITSAVMLDMLMSQAENIAASKDGDSLINAAKAATDDPESKAFVDNLYQVFSNMDNSKEFAMFKAKAAEQMQKTEAPVEVNESTAGEIAARANFAPQTLKHESVVKALDLYRAGKLGLSNAQVMRLEAAEALTKAMASLVQGPMADADPIALVTRQVGFNETKEDNQKYESVLEHHNNITSAIVRGDTETAEGHLVSLGLLAQTFNNKVQALNDSLGGKEVRYQNWVPSANKWRESAKGLFANLESDRSVKFARQVANEAALAIGEFNYMLESFPQLKGELSAITPVELSTAIKEKPVVAKPKKESKAKLGEHIAQRQNTLNNPPTDFSKEKAEEIGAWAKNQTERVKKQEQVTSDANRKEELADLRLGLERLIEQSNQLAQAEVERAAIQEPEPTTETEAFAEVDPEPEVVETEEPVETVSGTLNRAATLLPTKAGDNLLTRLFKSKATPSRFSEQEGSAADKVIAAFESEQAFKDFTGSEKAPSAEQLANAKDYFSKYGKWLIEETKSRFENFLQEKAPYKEATWTRAEDILSAVEGKPLHAKNTPPEEWKNGIGAYAPFLKLERNDDGSVTGNIDDYFLEAAGIAAAQYMLTAGGKGIAKYDEATVAAITGVPQDKVTDQLRSWVSTGLDEKDVIRGISEQLEKVLGIEVKPDAPMFRAQGLPLSLAIQMFETMIESEQGKDGSFFFEKLELTISEDGSVLSKTKTDSNGVKEVENIRQRTDKNEKIRTITRYIPLKPVVTNDKVGFASVLDQALNIEPDNIIYFDKNKVAVSATQLRSNVGITQAEKSAQQKQQETPHKLNPYFAKLLGKFSLPDLQRMLGGTVTEDMNVNTRLSKDGKAVTIAGSFNQAQFVLGEIAAQAQITGTKPEDLELFYKYETTATGRSMMQGKYNPQSDKVMRNLVMPMIASLDLTQEADMYAWNLGSIQMLGERAYAMTQDQVTAKASEIFTAPEVVEAIKHLETVLQDGDIDSNDLVSALEKASTKFEDGLTPESMHVLLDRARYNLSDDLTKFESRLYLEADGVANGPAGAMAMMTSDVSVAGLTDFVSKMRKAGFFIGQPNQVMNEYRQGDKVDLYALSGEHTAEYVKERLESYGDSKNAQMMKAHQTSLMELLSGMFPAGAISFNPTTNELVIKRGVTKNPLTVTVYGSGSQGIASKLLGIVEEQLYGRLSNGDLSNEVFPNAQDFVNYLQHMVTNAPVMKEGEKGKYWTVERKANGFKTPLVPTNYSEFTLSQAERKNLQDNIHHFFVKGMVKGIEKTVGTTVTGNRDLMVAATNMQTFMLQHAYDVELEKLYAEKRAVNPEWDPVLDGLSKKDFAKLEKSLSHLNIRLQTENQEWEVGNSEKATDEKNMVAMSPSRKRQIPALMRKPGGAGVQVVPYLVIGMGDSAMVQNLFNDPDAPEGKLQVFDGINLGLNDIAQGGAVVNKAMADAWLKGNPLRVVADSFKKALALGDFDSALESNPEAAKEINKLLEKFGSPEEVLSLLEGQANKIDSLHAAVEKVGFASDQMAATGVTHSVIGSIESENEVDVANAIRNEMIANSKEKADKVLSENQVTENFNVIQGADAVRRLVNSTFIKDNDLRELAKAALDTNGLTQLSDIKIVRGSAENLVYGQFVPEEIVESVLEGSTKGFWNPETNTMVLTDKADQETLAHELVHAATIQVLQASAQGVLPDTAWGKAVKESIGSLEGLLNDLLINGWDVSRYSESAQKSYQDMLHTIKREIGVWEDDFTLQDIPAEQRMNAVNELMAWTLSNRPVREMSKLQKFKQVMQTAIGLLKNILFGKDSKAPRLNSSVFAQVQFHTMALMNAQGNLIRKLNGAQQYAQGTLQHSVGYGQRTDIEVLGNTFQQKVGQHLKGRASVAEQINAYVNAKAANNYAIQVQADAQANGFVTTPQEASAYFKIVQALGTEAKINPLVLNEAQALFRQAVKELKVESFLENPNETDPAKLFAAAEKLNFVLGKSGVINDPSGRSSLLPNFIALGLIDPTMKKALMGIRTGRSKETGGKTFDEKITAAANNALDSLQDRLVNAGRNPANVEDALNSLAQTLMDADIRDQNLVEKLAMSGQDILNGINQFVVNSLEQGSKKVTAIAENVANTSNNKAVKTAANVVSFTTRVMSEEGAKANAEAMVRFANTTAMPEFLQSIIKDMTGRLDSQAGIYDMIKIASNKVSKIRQFYKEHLPTTLNKGFKTAPTEAQWTAMFNGFAKVDLASLIRGSNPSSALDFLDTAKRAAQIAYLEAEVGKAIDGKTIIAKAKQLANYMVTGEAGPNLLRNADAVANLVTVRSSQFNRNKTEQSPKFVRSVDELISLYALNQQSKDTLNGLQDLVRDDADGVQKILGVLKAQREQDQARRTGAARFNAMKGYIPSTGQSGASVVVADDKELKAMERKGYTRVADYTGSKIFAGTSMGYYFAPVSGKAPYNQGIIQNARMTSGGVDVTTGHAMGFPTAGRITQKATVDRLALNMHLDTSKEALMPIVDANGKIVGFERSIDPAQLERLKPSTHLAKMLGQWMGRQAEEQLATGVNQDAMARAYDMWKKDHTRRDEYINVLDKAAIKDPVMQDALSLMPREVRDEAERLFGKGKFMVRKDTFNDLFGYRDPSFSDFWNGNSRWSPETQERVRNALEGVLGKKALTILMTNEERFKNVIKDAKTLIVVKSVIVPAVNMVANVFQMMASGVPIQDIVRGLRDKTVEVDAYMKSNLRKMDLTVELMAAEGNVVRTNKLKAQIKSIEDSHKRLSIWPLIEAGELGSISDVGISRDEILLTEGKLQEYLEAKTDKLPDAVKSLGKNFLLTKDTALFQGLQKTMEYGDFLAKAIVFDNLRKKGQTQEQALGVITDEFVNYDRLPGRVRGSLENFGLAWFYNYKLRIAKSAFRMIRQDPVRLALISMIPVNGIETPVSENIFTKAVEGSLGYSLGPGMAFNSVGLNPWVNAMN